MSRCFEFAIFGRRWQVIWSSDWDRPVFETGVGTFRRPRRRQPRNGATPRPPRQWYRYWTAGPLMLRRFYHEHELSSRRLGGTDEDDAALPPSSEQPE